VGTGAAHDRYPTQACRRWLVARNPTRSSRSTPGCPPSPTVVSHELQGAEC